MMDGPYPTRNESVTITVPDGNEVPALLLRCGRCDNDSFRCLVTIYQGEHLEMYQCTSCHGFYSREDRSDV